MLSPNQDPVSEVMLSSTSDPNLSAFPPIEKDLQINLDLESNMAMDCSVESVDSFDLGEKLPFDEEMEVVIKGDDEFPSSTFPYALSSRPTVLKKTSVTAVKLSGKRKFAARKVSWKLLTCKMY